MDQQLLVASFVYSYLNLFEASEDDALFIRIIHHPCLSRPSISLMSLTSFDYKTIDVYP